MIKSDDIELNVNICCCICLNNENIKKCLYEDKITHIPCTCHYYMHKSCYDKTDKTKCVICKNPYKYEWGSYPDHILEPNCFYKLINFPYLKIFKIQYEACNFYCKKNNSCCWNLIVDFCFGFSLLLKLALIFFLITYTLGYFVNFLWALFFCDISNRGCFIEPTNGLIIVLGTATFAVCLPCVGICVWYYDNNRNRMTISRITPIEN